MSQKRLSTHAILPRIRVLNGKDIALGPGKVELLTHVQETGSIAEAARRMGMSYNRAWLLIRTINQCFRNPLVAPVRGGSGGGGAVLTPTGERALALYRKIEEESLKAAQRDWLELQELLQP